MPATRVYARATPLRTVLDYEDIHMSTGMQVPLCVHVGGLKSLHVRIHHAALHFCRSRSAIEPG